MISYNKKEVMLIMFIIVSINIVFINFSKISRAGINDEFTIHNITLAQVVDDPDNRDFVTNKTAIVRSYISAVNKPGIAEITLWYDGVPVNQTARYIPSIEPDFEVVDLSFKPNAAGSFLEVIITVNLGGFKSTYFNVYDTSSLKISFVPIDNPTLFYKTVVESSDFIQRVYPIADDGLTTVIEDSMNTNSLQRDKPFFLLLELMISNAIGSQSDRVVGLLPNSWFIENGHSGFGLSSFKASVGGIINSVIVEENIKHASAHEIGHTYGLCDEYNATEWDRQDTVFGLCLNGDFNPSDGELDNECYPHGCPVEVYNSLIPWINTTNFTIDMFNFMGGCV